MNYRRNRIILAFAVLAFTAMGCSKAAQPAGGGTEEAVTAANTWLAIVDAAKYGDSWEQTCAFFKGVVTKDQWVKQAGGVRGPLGPVQSREMASAEYTRTLPGAPDGEYVVIQYRTKFENKADAVETVTPMRDPDGVYRVSGYYIR